MARISLRAGAALTGLAAAALLANAPVSAAAQTYAPRIGNCTINDITHEHTKILRDEMEKRSNGRIKGEVFPNCVLGTPARQIEGVQLGTQDFYALPTGFLVGVDPRFAVLDVPGLFTSFEHAQKAFTHSLFYDRYMQLGRDKGITLVSLWASSETDYITLRPLRTIEDFRGVKMRVLGTKFETELMSRYGATGVPVPFPDIVPSLMSKLIDGARTAPVVILSAKMYTAAKYITVTADTVIPIITVASNAQLDKLPADLRQLVMKTGRDIQDRMVPMAVADQESAFKSLAENGVELIRLSREQQAEWMRRARQASDDYFGNEPNMKELYGILKQAADQTRG